MSFQGTVSATLTRKTGTTRTGEPMYAGSTPVRVGVVHLLKSIEKTSVRTDSSASRGSAEEQVATAKLLFEVVARPRTGDRINLVDQILRIEGVEPRIDVFGVLDHYETTLVLWDDAEGHA